jgi:ATP/maltotriose-dependent transcriptional regulator MalT
MWKGQAYIELARNDSALAILEDVVRRSERTLLSLAVLAQARAASGDGDGARAILREIDSRASSGYVPAFEVARVHAALGDRGRALDWLERAAKEHSHSIAFLTVDPALAPLRGDARFEALVRLRTN